MRPDQRSQLFAVAAREWRTYPDTAASTLRIGDLRSGAAPEPADPVAQCAYGADVKLFWLVRLAPDLKAKEELMVVQNINAVGTEYGGMLRFAVAGDLEALGRAVHMRCALTHNLNPAKGEKI